MAQQWWDSLGLCLEGA